MIGRRIRASIPALSAALVTLTSAAESRAQFCNLFNRPAPQMAVTTYRPIYAPAPIVTQTVNYMPVTGYRTFYAPTAVTTLQPVPACNACGGATTAMRPVVTYAMRPQLVPYTTYQPVVAAPMVAAAPACSACSARYAPLGATAYMPMATTSYAAPAPSLPVAPAYMPAAPAAPSCGCSGGGPAPLAAYGPPPGAVGSTVSSLAPPGYGGAGGANVAPSLSPTQPVPAPGAATYGQPVPSPGATTYGQPSAGAPSTTFASPSSSLYGGAPGAGSSPSVTYGPPKVVQGSTTVTQSPSLGSPSAGATLSGPPVITSPPPMPAGSGPTAPSNGPASRIVPNGSWSGSPTNGDSPAAPRQTFREDATDPLAPGSTRWTPRKAIPIPTETPSDPAKGPGDNGASPTPPPAGSGSGEASGVSSPQNMNFRQPPKPYDPEDRMASRDVIRQADVYPAVYSTARPVAMDDGGWHAAYPRP